MNRLRAHRASIVLRGSETYSRRSWRRYAPVGVSPASERPKAPAFRARVDALRRAWPPAYEPERGPVESWNGMAFRALRE